MVSRSGTWKNDFSCKQQQTKWRPLQNKLFFCKKNRRESMETQRKTFQNCPNIRVLHKEGKNWTNIFIYIKAILYIFHCGIFVNLKQSYENYFRLKHESGFFSDKTLVYFRRAQIPTGPQIAKIWQLGWPLR